MFDLDQKIFGWVHRMFRGLASRPDEVRPEAVSLAPIEERLAVLASAIAGRRVRIESSEGFGDIVGTTLRLPDSISVLDTVESNAAIYLERAILGATLIRDERRVPEGTGMCERRIAALAMLPAIVAEIGEELPGFLEVHRALAAKLHDPPHSLGSSTRAIAIGALAEAALADDGAALPIPNTVSDALREAARIGAMPSARQDRPPRAFVLAGAAAIPNRTSLVGNAPARGESGSLPTGTERRKRQVDAVERVELPREKHQENPIEHSFEKIHTADEYRGGNKTIDGEDALDEHADALDELDLHKVIRTNEVARSVYRMDGSTTLELDLAEDEPVTDSVVYYDEWDGTAYRKGHCRLAVDVPERRAGTEVPTHDLEFEKRKRPIRKVFEALEQSRRARARQPIGLEVDIDALIDRYGAVRAGHDGPTQLYVDRPRIDPDLATLVLIDLSSSSDAFVEGRRVVDIERDAVDLLGTVLDELSAPFAVGGFHSNTRLDCHYLAIKSFDEAWNVVRPRLYAAAPTGYTRVGPALRHAIDTIAQSPARRRGIVIVTDGRPTDYDRYEGSYGVVDVKKACDEAAVRGISVFALASAKPRAPHLTTMFGPAGFEVVSRPEDLANGLARAEIAFRR